MEDTDFEKKGDSLVSDAAQLDQLDDVVNEPKTIPNAITDLDGNTHTLTVETFSVYKTKQVLSMLAKARGEIDILKLIGDIQTIATPVPTYKVNPDGTRSEFTDEEKQQLTVLQAQRVSTAMETIPTLIEFVPDLLLEFGALAIIPNRELEAAYDKGGIGALRQEKRKWLDFHFDAAEIIKLLVLYLPHIGINLIVQELGKLDRTTSTLLKASQKASTG